MDESGKATGSFFGELRRRKVIRTCLLYVLVCWGALQVFDIVVPAMGYDADLVSRYFIYAAVLGFPVTFALAWFFQFTSHGIVRTQSFVERRVLDNVSPVNDRRRSGVSNFLRKGEEAEEHQWIVSAETGPLSGLSYPVHGELVLGRSLDCDLAIVTPHVSRQHARLDEAEDGLYIEDLGSSNGTVVNGKRASGRVRLRHDDELRFHDIIFRVTETLTRGHSERQASSQTTFIQAPDAGD
ncbi:hypothetical protein GCM10007052_12920 [Halioglobus japonicus]|uniref:FHA domain-containing protein n=1 Tax=Halioglobus japonicus TaxID=930805 RepID=A0AAP8MFF2_9GAMM|nr:FHA domain-containing protein [Halioglobus japonicus]PLW86557.1 FHA domain-containing protein [Halioglobus japonicus]GHD12265.1 hypothetical protein GCM10007052_12920 [Halioglobus japonicus]